MRVLGECSAELASHLGDALECVRRSRPDLLLRGVSEAVIVIEIWSENLRELTLCEIWGSCSRRIIRSGVFPS